MTVDPIYTVARHHGADDETARQLVALLRPDTSGYRDFWMERMTDLNGWCSRVPHEIPEYLTTRLVTWGIRRTERWNDPYDPDTLRVRAFFAATEAGGDFVSQNIETGEVTERYTMPGSRPGAAPEN